MSKCGNKDCEYWTRESDGTCEAEEFCGGFVNAEQVDGSATFKGEEKEVKRC